VQKEKVFPHRYASVNRNDPFFAETGPFFHVLKKTGKIENSEEKTEDFRNRISEGFKMFGEMERGIDGRISFVADSNGKLDFFDGKAYIN